MDTIIDSIKPDQFALLVSLFAITISDGLDNSVLNSLSNFIVAVGSTMQAISAQRELLATKQENSAR